MCYQVQNGMGSIGARDICSELYVWVNEADVFSHAHT